jgi:hypothetical protein
LHQCIYMTHCLYIFYYICTEMHVKIWRSIKRHVLNSHYVYKSSVFVFKKGMYTLRCMIPIVVSPFSWKQKNQAKLEIFDLVKSTN